MLRTVSASAACLRQALGGLAGGGEQRGDSAVAVHPVGQARIDCAHQGQDVVVGVGQGSAAPGAGDGDAADHGFVVGDPVAQGVDTFGEGVLVAALAGAVGKASRRQGRHSRLS